jgi:hypothetical protein
MVRRDPWDGDGIARLRTVISERGLTPVIFPGVRSDELNRPDELPGPPNRPGDWINFGAARLLSEDAEAFRRGWAFDIRPPTDDRPFFSNFSRLGSLGAFREAYGDLWPTRTELALLFVLAGMAAIAAAGAVLILLPLAFLQGLRAAPGKIPSLAYFGCIGLAYLMLEMTFLYRMTHLVGDSVTAGAVTITSFLVFSGLGSLAAQRLRPPAGAVAAGLVVVGISGSLLAPWLAGLVGGAPLPARVLVGSALIFPLGFLMGFPMPMGLARAGEASAALVPWAWGVNGFASVLASPLAAALAMTSGFWTAGGAALILYALAGAAFGFLPRRR